MQHKHFFSGTASLDGTRIGLPGPMQAVHAEPAAVGTGATSASSAHFDWASVGQYGRLDERERRDYSCLALLQAPTL